MSGYVCGYCPEGQEFCKLLVELVGTGEETIYKTFKLLLVNKGEYEQMRHACNPYGDGHAGERIGDILEKYKHWKDEVEEYIDPNLILNNLLMNRDSFLKPCICLK